jgi:hypothetical protein
MPYPLTQVGRASLRLDTTYAAEKDPTCTIAASETERARCYDHPECRSTSLDPPRLYRD